MTDITASRKCMTFGEGGTAITFAALAIFTLLIAANAHTPEYAFHAYLSAAASIASSTPGASTVSLFTSNTHGVRVARMPALLPPA